MKRIKKEKTRQRLQPLLLITILVFLMVISSLVAYAAMVSREQKVNEFQIGQLETKIDEVFQETTTINPGEDVVKKVQITNEGTLKQFVRIMLQPEISVDNKGVKRLLPSKIGTEILLDIDTKKWKYGEDGYYYYLEALSSKESTPNLFTSVKLNKDLGKEYRQSQFTLLVKAEASNTVKYAYRDAWWQSKIPTSGALLEVDQHLKDKVE